MSFYIPYRSYTALFHSFIHSYPIQSSLLTKGFLLHIFMFVFGLIPAMSLATKSVAHSYCGTTTNYHGFLSQCSLLFAESEFTTLKSALPLGLVPPFTEFLSCMFFPSVSLIHLLSMSQEFCSFQSISDGFTGGWWLVTWHHLQRLSGTLKGFFTHLH